MQSPKAFTLAANGAQIPAIGYGCMELPHRPAELVAAAIAAGYRHIDTARKYGTEERVGEGIRASGIARNELFVTTKVTELNAREADFLNSAETSLRALGLDYVDLLLVHWPQPKVPLGETLGALAKAKRRGLTRHIELYTRHDRGGGARLSRAARHQPGRVPRLPAAGPDAGLAAPSRHGVDRALPGRARSVA